MSTTLTRYGTEWRRDLEVVQFILVVPNPETLQHVQTAMEKDGWILAEWRPIP